MRQVSLLDYRIKIIRRFFRYSAVDVSEVDTKGDFLQNCSEKLEPGEQGGAGWESESYLISSKLIGWVTLLRNLTWATKLRRLKHSCIRLQSSNSGCATSSCLSRAMRHISSEMLFLKVSESSSLTNACASETSFVGQSSDPLLLANKAKPIFYIRTKKMSTISKTQQKKIICLQSDQKKMCILNLQFNRRIRIHFYAKLAINSNFEISAR